MSRRWAEATYRLFVAADLPPDAEAAIVMWQEAELAPRRELRLTRTLHLTLCFLGDVPQERAADIAEALAAIDLPPLPTAVAEPVFLPERGRKRVLALRLDDPSETIAGTQREVSDALVRLRVYRPERRPYLPHVTVARYRLPGHEFPLQNVNFAGFALPQVTLYTSDLQRGGAIHTPLASFPASL